MRIEMDRVNLSAGIQSVVRGQGNVVDGKYAHIWLENGLLWILPKVPSAGKDLRCYDPAGCEMYPKPGQPGLPQMPADEPKLAAVGGKK